MPNYSIIANTRFQNRSFDDLLKPLAMYTQEYNTLENALGELDTKASVWEGMANEQTDPEAYAQYKRYADDLRGQAATLAQNGLNINTNRDLLKMRRRYASEIAPIEQAYASRKAQADEQRKALLQNPTLLLSRRADMTSLDDYLRNPQLGYDSYSGALLTQQVGTAASTIAKELRDYGNGKKLDGFTKTWLQQHGFTAAEVAQAINNPDSPKSANVLNTLVNNVMADSGIPEWADRATLNQAYNYARQGLWQAVGQTNVQTYTDEAAKLAAQEASQKRVAKYAAGLQNNPDPTRFNPEFDTRNIRTGKDISKDAKDKKMLEKYKDYFEQDPVTKGWRMTEEGKKKYAETPYKYRGPYSTASDDVGTEFKDWIDSRGLSEMAKGRPGPYQSKLVQSIFNRASNLLDVNTAIEYVKGIGSENYDDVISSLNRISNKGKLDNYKRGKQKDDYIYTPADEVDVGALTTSDIKSAQVIYGKHGDFLEVNTKDGNTILQPFQVISPTYSSVVAGNRSMIDKYMEAKAMGIEVIDDQFGRPIPVDDWINAELNSYGDNLSSALSRTKVKPREVEPGYYGTR